MPPGEYERRTSQSAQPLVYLSGRISSQRPGMIPIINMQESGSMQNTDNHISSSIERCDRAATPCGVIIGRDAVHRPTVLSVAGSDSIGGAGIQADIKACMALGVFAMTAITAVTAQNTVGVRSYINVGAESVCAQLEAVFDDVRPDAVKIGMVPDGPTAAAIAEVLARRYDGPVVLDPVAVATSGDRLSDDSAAAEMVRRLFPMATVVTPNIPEARMLSGMDIATQSDMEAAARAIIRRYGCRAVLLKGGHLVDASAHTADKEQPHVSKPAADTETACTVDILMEAVDAPARVFQGPVVRTPNTHGTGCTLSSAIAAYLSRGYALEEAVARAKAWLTDALRLGADCRFGHGHGPALLIWKNNVECRMSNVE